MRHTSGKVYIIGEELIHVFENVLVRLELTNEQKTGLFFLPDKGKMKAPNSYIDLKEEIKNFDIQNPPTTSEILMKDPYAYIFTSGTTGLPKAAIIQNTSTLTAMIWWGDIVIGMKTEDVIYITTPLFHSHGLKVAFAAALNNGSAMAIARKFSASKFWDEIRKFNATCFNYVGEICRYLYNQPPKSDDVNNPVKKIVGNGLKNDIWVDFKKRFNISEIREFYGATEDFIPNFANIHNLDKTCGICLTPYAIIKYDIETDEPIRNEKGFMKKIKLGEVGLLLGKITDPENFYIYKDKMSTEKKVLRDVFEKGDMYINTGDLLRDIGFGHVQFVDRLGDTFRWKGENVSTEEVESIVNSFDQIEMCSVYGVLIPNIEGRAGMVSLIKKSRDFDVKKFLDRLKIYLPHYAIPLFIRIKREFETTATYKIQKVKLKEEGYNINKTNDPIFVLLPDCSNYTPLTKEIYEGINRGKYKF
jgi:citronellyl-CoA synthetase